MNNSQHAESSRGAQQGYQQTNSADFRCEHEGCGKTFTRKDHLLRHAANHTSTNYYCSRCNKAFKRLDLLHRHEKRNVCDPVSRTKRRRTAETDPANDEDSLRQDSSSPAQAHFTFNHDPLSSLTSNTELPISPTNHTNNILHSSSLSLPTNPNPFMTTISPLATHSGNPFNNTALNGHATIPNSTTPANLHIPSLLASNNNRNGGLNGSQGQPPHSAPAGSLNTSQIFSSRSDQILPDFEVSNSQNWGINSHESDVWDAILHDTLAPPFNEPAMTLDFPWKIPTPGPTFSESAERGGRENGDMTPNPALLAQIQSAIPEIDVGLSFLTEALSSYWSNVAPSFPFIHRGTFDLNAAPSQLVAMMAIVGAVHLNDRPRSDFHRVVQRIRGHLVQDCGFDMPITTLQAFSLCHVYDTWYGSMESLFVARCMWPVMVAHSRQKGIGVVGRPEQEAQEQEAWAAWAKDEERRRAAFCVLLIDTHISAFWNQHPSRQLSIFAHNIDLPCPRDQWNAPTAAEWFRLRDLRIPSPIASKKSKTGYLPGLHPEFQVSNVTEGYSASVLSALAAEQRLPFAVNIENALGVEMILMGLMAIAWDCRTRGGMGIKFKDGTKQWRSIVLSAVINLRASWELSIAHMPASIESRDMRDTIAISVISVMSDIPMLQVAAGASIVTGTSIGPSQYEDAQKRLRLWSKSNDAWTCRWQSARYLRQAMFADWGIYTPWAVYLTVLVHWADAWAKNNHDIFLPQASDANHQQQSILLLDHILSSTQQGSHFTTGLGDLIHCAAEKLGTCGEWEKDCSELLWRLLREGTGRRRMSRMSMDLKMAGLPVR